MLALRLGQPVSEIIEAPKEVLAAMVAIKKRDDREAKQARGGR